ncbi:DUF4824 family protein [Pseudomonas aeruginosa]|nr:DUF4824 family protein [Pseudomonas aeruginosa]
MNRNRRNALIAGSLLLLAANLAALGGVAWNRSGEAESKLVLSQRELQRNWSYGFWSEENSGVELRLELRSPNGEPPNDLAPRCRPSRCAPSVSASRTRSTKRAYGATAANRKNRCCWSWSSTARPIAAKYAWPRSAWPRPTPAARPCPRTKCCPARWKPLATN